MTPAALRAASIVLRSPSRPTRIHQRHGLRRQELKKLPPQPGIQVVEAWGEVRAGGRRHVRRYEKPVGPDLRPRGGSPPERNGLRLARLCRRLGRGELPLSRSGELTTRGG